MKWTGHILRMSDNKTVKYSGGNKAAGDQEELLLLLLLLYRKRLTWHLVLSELQGHVTMSKS